VARRQVTAAQQRLLAVLSGRISTRLELVVDESGEADAPNVGITLRERGHSVSMEIPYALLDQAEADPTSREALRIRLKGRRDRMMFRPPPTPLPKNIVQSRESFMPRNFGGGGGPRGRR
jgi:hypothetical protein